MNATISNAGEVIAAQEPLTVIDLNEDEVFSMDEALIALVKETVESCMHFEEVLITRAGGTVSSHCGPGTLGVLFVNK